MVGDQPAPQVVGVLGVAEVPGSVEGVEADDGQGPEGSRHRLLTVASLVYHTRVAFRRGKHLHPHSNRDLARSASAGVGSTRTLEARNPADVVVKKKQTSSPLVRVIMLALHTSLPCTKISPTSLSVASPHRTKPKPRS